MPSLVEEECETNGWARIYKMLISPFSNTFKKYIQAKLNEKKLQNIQFIQGKTFTDTYETEKEKCHFKGLLYYD